MKQRRLDETNLRQFAFLENYLLDNNCKTNLISGDIRCEQNEMTHSSKQFLTCHVRRTRFHRMPLLIDRCPGFVFITFFNTEVCYLRVKTLPDVSYQNREVK